ncbi:hypothetical protein [Fulvivirga sedimenti]|uniref:Uncharacterized protein n=1 Tax=Fulvivirga sedimenti TaxID=2879465 RepID=A0A9X1HN20_9BACT|nr:hypothetical protein [Fulvivirga sedimenti]MCA6074871.1 hypothetical protein [Fulvivirga sedimenti]MCA6076048.1 hypothetical protein [Fulvivirga sedimenti]MCA6077176.1 hypothetical protein [Fulvivirga sedimenti]
MFAFKYKWIILASMIGFNILLWVHFQLKLALITRKHTEAGGLLQLLKNNLDILLLYRNVYRYGIPLFAGFLMLLYAVLYMPPVGFIEISAIAGVVLFSSLIVEALWKLIYHEHVRKIKSLKGICERLSDPHATV